MAERLSFGIGAEGSRAVADVTDSLSPHETRGWEPSLDATEERESWCECRLGLFEGGVDRLEVSRCVDAQVTHLISSIRSGRGT